jgi:hypothetical protein
MSRGNGHYYLPIGYRQRDSDHRKVNSYRRADFIRKSCTGDKQRRPHGDCRMVEWLAKGFGLRALQLDYVRTSLPNASTNSQNDFRLGLGITYRIRHR